MGIMPRVARVVPARFDYHVLNRSVGRMHMFRKEADFEAFERVMVEAHARQPIRIHSELRVSIERGRPYRADEWIRRTVEKLGLQHIIRPEGRPP
jgi:hypothetical protein